MNCLTMMYLKCWAFFSTLHKKEGEHILDPYTLEEGDQHCGNRGKNKTNRRGRWFLVTSSMWAGVSFTLLPCLTEP